MEEELSEYQNIILRNDSESDFSSGNEEELVGYESPSEDLELQKAGSSLRPSFPLPPRPPTSDNFDQDEYEMPVDEYPYQNSNFQGNDARRFPSTPHVLRGIQNVQNIRQRPLFPVQLPSQNEGRQPFQSTSHQINVTRPPISDSNVNIRIRPTVAIKSVYPVSRPPFPNPSRQPSPNFHELQNPNVTRNFGTHSFTPVNPSFQSRFQNSSLHHQQNIQNLHNFHQPNLIRSAGAPSFPPPTNHKFNPGVVANEDGGLSSLAPLSNRLPIFREVIPVVRPLSGTDVSRSVRPSNLLNNPSSSSAARYYQPGLIQNSLSQKFQNTESVNRFSPPPLIPVSKPSPSLVPVSKSSIPSVHNPSSQFDPVHGSYHPVVPINKPSPPSFPKPFSQLNLIHKSSPPLVPKNKSSSPSVIRPPPPLASLHKSSEPFLPINKFSPSPSLLSIHKPSATVFPSLKPAPPLVPKPIDRNESFSTQSSAHHLPAETFTENEILKLNNGEAIPMTELYKSLLKEKYFHPIHKSSSGAYLPDGTFLLRPSKSHTDEKPLTLCLRYNGKVYAFAVERRNTGLYSIGTEKEDEMQFATVQEMMSYYRDNPFYFEGVQTYFIHPGTEPPSI